MGYAVGRGPLGRRVQREVHHSDSPEYTERWTAGWRWGSRWKAWHQLGIQATYEPLKFALFELQEDTKVQPHAPLPIPPGLSGDDRTLLIHALSIPPERRGAGWGRRFVEALEREARRGGGTRR